MPASSNFLYPQLHINGLYLPNIFIDRDGHVHFGCITCHAEDLLTVTRQQIIDHAGVEAADWWDEWKGVLVPFFQKVAAEIDNYWTDTDPTQIILDVAESTGSAPYLYRHFSPMPDMPAEPIPKGPKKPPEFK